MSVYILCPKCRQKLKLPDGTILGKKVLCPKCHEAFISEEADPAALLEEAERKRAEDAARDAAEPEPPPMRAKPEPGARPESKRAAAPAAKKPASVKEPEAKRTSKISAKETQRLKAKPAEEEEVFEVEVVEEDEWADLAPAPLKSVKKSKLPAAPAVIGKKKKKADAERKSGEHEELTLSQHRMLMVGTGIVGALIATGLWAAVIHWRGLGSGWLAMLVGLCVGVGVRAGASKHDFGWAPALTASGLTFVAIIGGKFIASSILMAQKAPEYRDRQAAYVTLLEHENYQIEQVAEELIVKKQKKDMDYEGHAFDEDDDTDYESSRDLQPDRIPKQYNAELWREATETWKEMPDAERAKRKEAVDAKITAAKSGKFDDPHHDVGIHRPAVIDILDVIWLFVSVTAAFRLATGQTD